MKKGGAEAPPISLYKYNTFRRQKQEVLKPKNRLGVWKRFSPSSRFGKRVAQGFTRLNREPFTKQRGGGDEMIEKPGEEQGMRAGEKTV